MQKALKMLVAGLNAVKVNGLNTNLVGEVTLQKYFDITMNSVRQVLCVFNVSILYIVYIYKFIYTLMITYCHPESCIKDLL